MDEVDLVDDQGGQDDRDQDGDQGIEKHAGDDGEQEQGEEFQIGAVGHHNSVDHAGERLRTWALERLEPSANERLTIRSSSPVSCTALTKTR